MSKTGELGVCGWCQAQCININKKDDDKLVFGSFFIGDMEILFNDGSAKSRKETGDEIKIQIESEIKKYESKK